MDLKRHVRVGEQRVWDVFQSALEDVQQLERLRPNLRVAPEERHSLVKARVVADRLVSDRG